MNRDMALEAPAEPKQKKIVLDWQRTGINERNYNKRDIKMVAALCKLCQEKNLPRWWTKCEHNPYFSSAPRKISIPTLACSKCGDEVEPGTPVHCDQTSFEQRGTKEKVVYENVANTRSVRLDPAHNQGRGVEIQKAKGWKLPEELGIAVMCQHSRCWEPLQDTEGRWREGVVRSPAFGDYCSDRHARLVALEYSPEATEIFNDRIRGEQIRSINVA